MVFLAATVLVIAIVFGFVSRGHSAPPAANLPTFAATPAPLGRQIDAVVQAIAGVRVSVIADGVAATYRMGAGETRTFTAQDELALSVSDGGHVRVKVDGRNQGLPGPSGRPWSQTFSFGTGGGSGPSPG
jgi:hypothetical protein